MKKTSRTIIFFGSGPVAAESLRSLAEHFSIEAVVTKPRPPHHKGDVPVLQVASKLNLPVKTASNKQELDQLFDTKPFNSQVAILIDFGIIVSQKVIDYFPLGIINSHFSLLPEWRGADPITFSILSGQQQTGVSLMMLVERMDEGPLLAQRTYHIKEGENTSSLTHQLIKLSAGLLQDIIPRYLEGGLQPAPQELVTIAVSKKPSYSRKLTKNDGILDTAKTADTLEREVRAFCEWPKSHINIHNLELIITQSHVVNAAGTPGAPTVINKLPAIFCSNGALVFDKLKPAGKQEMTGEAFLAGYKTQFLA